MSNKKPIIKKTDKKSPTKPQVKTSTTFKGGAKPKPVVAVVEKPKAEPKKEVAKVIAPVVAPKAEAKKVATKSPAKTKEKKPAKTKVESPIETVPLIDNNPEEQPAAILDIPAVAPVADVAPVVEKSAQHLAYEAEVKHFNSLIENTCKYWESHCSAKSHTEKHNIVSTCEKQGISVKFDAVNADVTKVTFTKGKTSFSFETKTIFW